MNRISLCVPTRNRAPMLRHMLDQLLTAIGQHAQPQRFQVVISDNASTDDTAEVIGQAVSRFPPIELLGMQQAKNLGFGGNFAAVVQMASAETFVILADDDELQPRMLDTLVSAADRLSPSLPMVLFDSLPGGDAVFRAIARPETELTIHGPHELLRQLGIFHASFVSNLMCHRASAMQRWKPAMLQSRYPHAMLAWAMLGERPAAYVPKPLVKVTLPNDTGDQPLLTSIDMARVMSQGPLNDQRCRPDANWVYTFLMKMLPTAIYQHRTGKCLANRDNPFADLRLRNVLSSYRRSKWAQAKATVLWLVARCLPVSWLGAVLRRLSRHPR